MAWGSGFIGAARFMMGLFDFFRRKPQKSPARDLVEADLPEPRCHHYTLAHYALRSVAFERPLAFLGVLASPDAAKFLTDLMRSVSEHCREREPRPDFSSDDLTLHKVRVGVFPCAVIEMPRPRAITEAFFVAAVLLADLDQELPEEGVSCATSRWKKASSSKARREPFSASGPPRGAT